METTDILKVMLIGGLMILATVIVLSLGANINQDLKDDEVNNTVYSKANVPVTVYYSNQSNSSLSTALVQEGSLKIKNSTAELGLGNFTVNYNLGTIAIAVNNAVVPNGTAVTANFSYLSHSRAWNVSGNTEEGLNTFGENAPNVALVFVAAVVIALVVGLFGYFKVLA